MRFRSLLCSALALCCTPALWAADAQQVWAPGVSDETGWYDYNKQKLEGDFLGDTGLCWAYSASNVLAWWQHHNADKLTANNIVVPQNEQIVKTFVGVFKNTGGYTHAAYDWWINGGEDCELNKDVDKKDKEVLDLKDTSKVAMELGLTGFDIKDLAEGGLLKGIYDTPTNDFRLSGGVYYDAHAYAKLIIDALADGYALSLSAALGSASHSYTLWGVQYEETNGELMITKAWITNSDDEVYGLIEKNVKFGEGNNKPAGLYFDEGDNVIGATWGAIAGIRTTSVIPEPGTATLTLMALAGLALRRRRS